jgi:nitrate/nitrite transporter NarK
MSLYMLVVGTAIAISGGWDASGAGFVQSVVGTVIYPFCVYITNGDTNLAWRICLIVPAILALYCVDFFYKYNDDCPLEITIKSKGRVSW